LAISITCSLILMDPSPLTKDVLSAVKNIVDFSSLLCQ
jgi:hypothetical protein